MLYHANLLTELQHRTGRAFWLDSGADMFAEGDEELVDFDTDCEAAIEPRTRICWTMNLIRARTAQRLE